MCCSTLHFRSIRQRQVCLYHDQVVGCTNDCYWRSIRRCFSNWKIPVQSSEVEERDFGTEGHQFLVPARGVDTKRWRSMTLFLRRLSINQACNRCHITPHQLFRISLPSLDVCSRADADFLHWQQPFLRVVSDRYRV